ncbi:hypothetical protein, partial [Dorea sp. D27]|uniref:hypothetical protein n=1 Tax=Dorea sp. D27 TaxID=658665 RepID=UPI001A9A485F
MCNHYATSAEKEAPCNGITFKQWIAGYNPPERRQGGSLGLHACAIIIPQAQKRKHHEIAFTFQALLHSVAPTDATANAPHLLAY